MTLKRSSNVTHILREANGGEPEAARRLAVAVYDELRGLAAKYMDRERQDHTLQPTALVHEAFLKLVDQTRVDWQGRTHFFAVGAEAMRRVLVDHARHRQTAKRGGGMHRVKLDEDLAAPEGREQDVLALDDVLQKLEKLDPRQAKMVELRFFGGLSVEEAAAALEISKRTAEREWTMVRAWLRRELSQDEA